MIIYIVQRGAALMTPEGSEVPYIYACCSDGANRRSSF